MWMIFRLFPDVLIVATQYHQFTVPILNQYKSELKTKFFENDDDSFNKSLMYWKTGLIKGILYLTSLWTFLFLIL